MLIVLFWILIGVIVYTYAGYTLILIISHLFIKRKSTPSPISEQDLPQITHVIAAYNEAEIIPSKIENCHQLDYPKEKIEHLWVIDGSDDNSENILKKTKGIKLLFEKQRKGKTAAINRAMQTVKTPITVFSDANTMLSKKAIRNMAELLSHSNVGCIAGEKRIIYNKTDKASAAGEGQYWNYESFIKKLESSFGSTMGAVGELYAIKTSLFDPPPENTILDDFMVSMDIAEKGYKIVYSSEAFAQENSSFNIREEMKRKSRIAAGGFQVLALRKDFLNFRKHPKFSFQYLSHKVLRWLVTPLCLGLLFIVNFLIVIKNTQVNIFSVSLGLQLFFYLIACIGYMLRNTPIRIKMLFLPYYFFIANYSQIIGLVKFLSGRQNVAWEKSKRTS